jgi:alpha-N-acetylglucosamine transferase
MNNITYTITDRPSSADTSESEEPDSIEWQTIEEEIQIKKCKYSNDTLEQKINETYARTVDYELNYNMKYLNTIIDFYEVKRQKLNKKELIKKIVEFEIDPNNEESVQRRHRLFTNFAELKNDKFFGKYIMGGL